MIPCSSVSNQYACSSCLSSDIPVVFRHSWQTPRSSFRWTFLFWHPAGYSSSCALVIYQASRWSARCRVSSRNRWRCIRYRPYGQCGRIAQRKNAASCRYYCPSLWRSCQNPSARTQRCSCCNPRGCGWASVSRLRQRGPPGVRRVRRRDRKQRSGDRVWFRCECRPQLRLRYLDGCAQPPGCCHCRVISPLTEYLNLTRKSPKYSTSPRAPEISKKEDIEIQKIYRWLPLVVMKGKE